MAFEEDRHNHKLYINNNLASPSLVTVKYIPLLHSVEDIKDQYWLDILIRMGTAMTKVLLGRIRTRFSLTNALWGMDGEKLLEEGSTDLKEIRETLRVNADMVFGID